MTKPDAFSTEKDRSGKISWEYNEMKTILQADRIDIQLPNGDIIPFTDILQALGYHVEPKEVL